MFLTREDWRHPNAMAQALASPATAWQCFALFQDLSLLAEIRHFEADEHISSEWMLIARPELLLDCIELSPQRLGGAQILVRTSTDGGSTWCLETLVSIEQWRHKDRSGLCCMSSSGARYSWLPYPDDARISRVWSLPTPSHAGLAG
jgi:hypothetical protein